MSKLLLKNVRAVLPSGETENASILISEGKISEIGAEEIKAESFIDLQGARLFPGFIDVHIHGAMGVDVNEASVSGLADASRFLAQKGITAWLPTLVPDRDENYQKTINAIDELIALQRSDSSGARALGVHYEGPFVNEKQCGALRTQFFKSYQPGDSIGLPRLKTENAAHLTTLAPEIENGIELIKELTRQNWIVSIGHTRAETATLDAACDAGARHMTHFFNAMTGLHHRNVGVVGWGLMKDEVTFDIIADGVHVHPEMLRFAHRVKTAEKITLISDAVAPAGLGDGDFEIWNEKISVINGKTQNERGSIAGSVITMLDAVRMMLALGVSATDVARMASANPARLLGIENETGTIETGKRADLVALNADGNIILTIIGGQIAFQS